MDQCTHCIVRGDIDKCRPTECSQHESWYAKIIETQLAEALAMLKEANHAVAEDDAEIQQLESKFTSLKESYCLAAESYDANARGWQADIKEIYEDSNKFIQALGLISTCAPKMEIDIEDPVGMMLKVAAEFDKLRSENERLSYELSKVVGLVPDALIESGKIEVTEVKDDINALVAALF